MQLGHARSSMQYAYKFYLVFLVKSFGVFSFCVIYMHDLGS
jgi:hypothetical protein